MEDIWISPRGVVHHQRPRMIVVGNRTYSPPTDELLLKAGWSKKNNEPIILPIEDSTVGDSKNPE